MKISRIVRIFLFFFFLSLFFIIKYFDLWLIFASYRHVDLYNAHVSTETVHDVTLMAQEIMLDAPVSCVLSYGTFFVPQHDCDFLQERDSVFFSSTHYHSCSLPAGYFLLTEAECAVLLRAEGSQDVMRRIHE